MKEIVFINSLLLFSFLFKIKQFISVNSLKLANIVYKSKDKNKISLICKHKLIRINKKNPSKTSHSKPNLKCSENPRLGIQICLHAITVISKETAFYEY